MYGAIIGDIVGSRFEWVPIKRKDFAFFYSGCHITDDTVMTVAVAEALLTDRDFAGKMRKWGRRYPDAGYGQKFMEWLMAEEPRPYGSWGNGSAMRVSPCGLYARSLEEALELARQSAVVSHDHPDAVKGAQAIAAAVYLAKSGSAKAEIRDYIRSGYDPLEQTLDEIRPGYRFDSSCRGSVPQAIQAFLEADDFEDAIRNAVSLGGDSDTLAAMAGSIAWAYYSRNGGLTARMRDCRRIVRQRVETDMWKVIHEFSEYIDGKQHL